MSWFVMVDGSKAEGPFEDAAIIEQIEKGWSSFRICKVGTTEWRDPSSHPPFAKALKRQGKGGSKVSEGAVAVFFAVVLLVGLPAYAFGVFDSCTGTKAVSATRSGSDFCKKECKELGDCHRKGLLCEATSDDHCRQSDICKESGACKAKDGLCIVGGTRPSSR